MYQARELLETMSTAAAIMPDVVSFSICASAALGHGDDFLARHLLQVACVRARVCVCFCCVCLYALLSRSLTRSLARALSLARSLSLSLALALFRSLSRSLSLSLARALSRSRSLFACNFCTSECIYVFMDACL